MERTSRFSSFIGKAVMSGSKPSGSAFPEIVATSTKDKFSLNKKAMALMGLSEGSYVVLIDVNRGKVTTEDHNARYFITPGWKNKDNQYCGAKISKQGVFSYAGIYSAIQMDDPQIDEATVKDMVDNGKGILRETKGKNESFIATQKVSFKVEELTEKDEEGNDITEFEVAAGVFQKVYALTAYTIIPHDPKEVEKTADGEEIKEE